MVLNSITYYFKPLLLVVVLCSFTHDTSHWLNKSGLKKLEKSIFKTWGTSEVNQVSIPLPSDLKKRLNMKSKSLYKLSVNEEFKGYLFLDSQRSKFDTFDYMVILNKDLSIKKVDILVYREAYGGEICSKVFLKQFHGKTSQSKIKIGDDIQGISGATISCRAAVNGVKTLTKKAVLLKNEGYI